MRVCHCPHLPPPTGGTHRFQFTGLKKPSISCYVFFWSWYTGCISMSRSWAFSKVACILKSESLHVFLGLATGGVWSNGNTGCRANETWVVTKVERCFVFYFLNYILACLSDFSGISFSFLGTILWNYETWGVQYGKNLLLWQIMLWSCILHTQYTIYSVLSHHAVLMWKSISLRWLTAAFRHTYLIGQWINWGEGEMQKSCF